MFTFIGSRMFFFFGLVLFLLLPAALARGAGIERLLSASAGALWAVAVMVIGIGFEIFRKK